MKQKLTQKEKVFEIVRRAGDRGVKTQMVMLRAMKRGVGNADRRLRELQEDCAIEGQYCQEGSRVKTWISLV